MADLLGLYLSIPFCRGKCTFCNFASDAFDPGQLPAYVDALCREILELRDRMERMGADLMAGVDTVYLGGGTPSLLRPQQVEQIFGALGTRFVIEPDAEITVECAPGQLAPETLDAFRQHGVNRISFGVQSFVDHEAAAVGRRHTGAECRREIDRVRDAGIPNVGVDLIAGLPHQTRASWLGSLHELLASGAQHASVYLLEVDEDSRLGREVLRSGDRFGATSLPDEDLAATLYEDACEVLSAGGMAQYEISNFAAPERQSRHNLKYWQRKPYLGFGLDAHSMVPLPDGSSLRFANTEDLPAYVAASGHVSVDRSNGHGLALYPPTMDDVADPHQLSARESLEETLFLGLRMNEGLSVSVIARAAPASALAELMPVLDEAREQGLLHSDEGCLQLTPRGRLLSNELFSRLLLPSAAV